MAKIKCTMARHCRTLAEQGVWSQIERLTHAASFRKTNKEKPDDEHQFPTLYAARETLADACNCALTTIDGYLVRFVEYGMLVPIGKQHRLPNGKWSSNVYRVMLHDWFCKDHPCPPFRSERTPTEPVRAFQPVPSVSLELVLLIIGFRQSGMSFKEIAATLVLPKTNIFRLYRQGIAFAEEMGWEPLVSVPVVPETVPSLGS